MNSNPPNRDQYETFFLACRSGKIEILKDLLEQGFVYAPWHAGFGLGLQMALKHPKLLLAMQDSGLSLSDSNLSYEVDKAFWLAFAEKNKFTMTWFAACGYNFDSIKLSPTQRTKQKKHLRKLLSEKQKLCISVIGSKMLKEEYQSFKVHELFYPVSLGLHHELYGLAMEMLKNSNYCYSRWGLYYEAITSAEFDWPALHYRWLKNFIHLAKLEQELPSKYALDWLKPISKCLGTLAEAAVKKVDSSLNDKYNQLLRESFPELQAKTYSPNQRILCSDINYSVSNLNSALFNITRIEAECSIAEFVLFSQGAMPSFQANQIRSPFLATEPINLKYCYQKILTEQPNLIVPQRTPQLTFCFSGSINCFGSQEFSPKSNPQINDVNKLLNSKVNNNHACQLLPAQAWATWKADPFSDTNQEGILSENTALLDSKAKAKIP